MSTLRVMNLQNASGTGTINVSTGNKLTSADAAGVYSKGQVVQVIVNRFDSPYAYSVPTTGVEFTDLRLSITPKFVNSLIICTFQIHGEGTVDHGYILRVYKNGAIPTGTYAGYNSVQGNQSWSGLAMAVPYETDFSSTPFTQTMHYYDFPATTSTINYSPGVVLNAAGTYYLNRTVGSTGQAGHETGVSFVMITEVAQ